MFNKIKSFLLDEEQIDNVIWYTGYIVIGWLLCGLAWIASKTKNKVDDTAVEVAKEKVKTAKSKKQK